MKIEERINADLKKAMKEKDQNRISVLRMAKAAIQNVSIEKKTDDLKDEDIIKIIRSLIKKHKDSIEQFTKGGRDDLVRKETAEMKVLEQYMPEGLSEDELKKIINEVISNTDASTKADMGRVMKAVMEKVKGRADGKQISQIVSGLLK